MSVSAPVDADGMRRVVDELLASAEVLSCPAPLPLLASFRGVRGIREVSMAQAARLVPVDGGFEIQVNESHPQTRQRFSIAHEIGHTFFPLTQRPVDDQSIGTFDVANAEEYLCDIAAARMLFHPQWLTKLTARLSPGFDGLASIAEQCGGSLEATGRAIADDALWSGCGILVLEPGYRKKEREQLGQYRLAGVAAAPPRPKLRVARAYMATGLPFIPRNKSVDASSVAHRAWIAEARARGEEELDLGRTSWVIDMDAAWAPFTNSAGIDVPRVLAVARFIERLR